MNGPLRPLAGLAAIAAAGLLAARAGSLGGGSAVAGWVLLVAFAIGLPVAMLVYASAHRRVGVIVLALCVGLSVNVVYVANAVPANAAADNTNQFWFNNCCTQTFACPSGIWDLLQSSAGLTSNTSRGGGAAVSPLDAAQSAAAHEAPLSAFAPAIRAPRQTTIPWLD